MSVITLTSDYGLLDYRVAAIKGSILSLKPDAVLTDLSHEIQAYNLLQTSYIVRNAYNYFPAGSIHVIAVDSFFHRERKNIVMYADGHYFVAADNGVLSLIFHDINAEDVYEITYNTRFDDDITFTATDILAPVAVHLANGGVPEVIGRRATDVKENYYPRAVYNEAEGMIVGEVLYVDNFGNVVTNINKRFFSKQLSKYGNFELKFRNLAMSKIYAQYTDIVGDWETETQQHGKAVAIFNARDLLEITIYKGSLHSGASSLLGLQVGEKVYIEFSQNQ
ncbi:MAG: hypothetical protein EAS48_02135 [Chryseobacterium sp.]|nr:MAG: hypothetical protein EAS48_02135 [Chryseobacterium sp.]